MPRKKVDLTYISSDSKRKTTLKKRRNGLFKKMDEISTLCGIEACAIVYSPNDPQPEVWPSAWGVQTVLSRFRTMPEPEQSRRMLNQENFMKQSIHKSQMQLKKQRNENRKKEITNLMFQCLDAGQISGNVNLTDLNDLSLLIDQNLKEIEGKINQIQDPEIIENGAEIVSGGEMIENGVGIASVGEEAQMGQDQVPKTKVDAMQMQDWSMDFINDGFLPFGDFNVQNDLWPNPQFP